MTEPGSRKATRHDVAVRAGVSDAVVSYALNGGAPVAPATRARVLEAVAALGYRPNQAARALRSGSARTIVLVVPEDRDPDDEDPVFANPFFSEYASSIERAARDRGYALSTTASSLTPEAVLAAFAGFAARQVDGVLVLPGGAVLDGAALDAAGLPWLQLDAVTSDPTVGSIGADLGRGAELATAHLLAHGRSRVDFVGMADVTEPRYSGWRRACSTGGVPPGRFWPAALTRPGGHEVGRRIVAAAEQDGWPDAIFVASDRTAVGVLRAFHEHGVRVPDDVALAAFDGTWEGEYSWPSLTSFRQPVEAMAAGAVDRVLGRRTGDAQHEVFDGELVLRRSCGCHPVSTDAPTTGTASP